MSWDDISRTADWMSVARFVISLTVLLGTLCISGYVVSHQDVELGQVSSLLIGGLVAAFSQVVSYYIGSSSGSASKDKLLNGGVGGIRRG